jgi:hypothetical protein
MNTYREWVVLVCGIALVLLAVAIPINAQVATEALTESPANGTQGPFTVPEMTRSAGEVIVCSGFILGVVLLVAMFVARRVKQPAEVNVIPFSGPHDSANVGSFIRNNMDKLLALNFSNPLDFTVPELPHEGFYRVMFGSEDYHQVLLAEIETKRLPKQFVNYMEFQTVLDNGVKINTNNSPFKPSFNPPPNIASFNYQRMSDVRDLFDAHRADVERVRTQRGGSIAPQRREDFARKFENGWKEVMEYQAATGLLKRAGDGARFRGTVRLVFRTLFPSIKNRTSAARMTLVLALGAPCMGLLVWLSPNIVQLLQLQGYLFLATEVLAAGILSIALAAGYAAGSGGFMVGLLCCLPTMMVFTIGPLDSGLLAFMSMNAGALGEKLGKMPGPEGLPLHKHLSPELYTTIFLMLVFGLSWSI